MTNIEPIPEWLGTLAVMLHKEGITQPDKFCNHYLVNHYTGAIGIMPHTDGPLYHPFVCILSLGSPVLFKIYNNFNDHRDEKERAVLLIEPNSLFIFTEEYYHDCLHCISDCSIETIRITLSFDDSEIRIKESSIQNLESTSIFKNCFQDITHHEGSGLINLSDCIEKRLQKFSNIYSLESKVDKDEQHLIIWITWKRVERISITVRNVKIA